MGTGFFSGVNQPGRGVDHPPPSSAEVKEGVELYLYSTFGPSWPVTGLTLPLPCTLFVRFDSPPLRGGKLTGEDHKADPYFSEFSCCVLSTGINACFFSVNRI